MFRARRDPAATSHLYFPACVSASLTLLYREWQRCRPSVYAEVDTSRLARVRRLQDKQRSLVPLFGAAHGAVAARRVYQGRERPAAGNISPCGTGEGGRILLRFA